MSTMQFDESQFKFRSRKILGDPEVPSMIRFLVTKGIVKTESHAVVLILIFIVAICLVSFFIFKSNSPKPATLDPEFLSTISTKHTTLHV